MIQWLGFSGTIFTTGSTGGFGLSFLFIIWTWLFQPTLFNDGQYMMIFAVTFPLGWLAGSLLGSITVLFSKGIRKPRHPFLTCIGWVIGGLFVTPIVGMMLMIGLFMFIGSIIG